MDTNVKILIDSAEVDVVQHALAIGLASGVTTNPTLLKRAGVQDAADLRERLELWRRYDPEHAFVQAWGGDAPALEASGAWIAATDGSGLGASVKLPATPVGFAAANALIPRGIDVLMTAVYTSEQAIAAAQIGAWGVAPYLGRMNDAGIDGMARIEEMVRVLAGEPTGVLAASIRDPREVVGLRERGVRWFTLSEGVLHGLVRSDLTDRDTATFEADAEGFNTDL